MLSGLGTAGDAAMSVAVVEVVEPVYVENPERNSVSSSLAWLMLTGIVGVRSFQLSLLAVPGLDDGERVGL